MGVNLTEPAVPYEFFGSLRASIDCVSRNEVAACGSCVGRSRSNLNDAQWRHDMLFPNLQVDCIDDAITIGVAR